MIYTPSTVCTVAIANVNRHHITSKIGRYTDGRVCDKIIFEGVCISRYPQLKAIPIQLKSKPVAWISSRYV
jgi:hypothetical protein